MQFIYINRKTKQIDICPPFSGNAVLTAKAFLGERHKGMVFTPVYLAATDHTYDVFSGGDFVADHIKRLAIGTPEEKDEKGKVTKEAVPGDLDAAAEFARGAGALVGKLTVAPPKMDA